MGSLPGVRRLLLILLVPVALVLGACGSTKTPSATSSGSPTASGSPTNPTSSSALTPADPPAVSAPTNLNKEPVIGPGASPPPTNLVTKDLVVGKGRTAVASDRVAVNYVGADYTTGRVFDDGPWKLGLPTPFTLSQVVPGFAQGIVGMKIGGRREIIIPPALGYGANGSPPAVAPNETLVFVVDLKAIQ